MLGLLLLMSCRGMRDNIASPGRYEAASVADSTKRLLQTCEQMGGCATTDLEIIGHQAGSYRNYPMDVTRGGEVLSNGWPGSGSTAATDILPLLDAAFGGPDMDAVEIDVQALPAAHPQYSDSSRVVVLHDLQKRWRNVDANSPAAEHFRTNTLSSVLKHFASEGLGQTKRLYIEIKSRFGCNAPDNSSTKCTYTSEVVAQVLSEQLTDTALWRNSSGKPCITIISFSATALETVRAGLPKHLWPFIDFALIAGVDRGGFRWLVGQAKGSVPIFTKQMRQFVTTTDWLQRIWFSAQGIRDFESVFAELDAARKKECANCSALGYSVAVYPLKTESFHKRMLPHPTTTYHLPLKSMMIDVDDRPAEADK